MDYLCLIQLTTHGWFRILGQSEMKYVSKLNCEFVGEPLDSVEKNEQISILVVNPTVKLFAALLCNRYYIKI